MRVTISVPGKFHAYDLAWQLNQGGHLEQLITSYPEYKTKSYGIPRDKVTSILLPEIIARISRKIPGFRKIWNPHFFVSNLYDGIAAKKLKKCDICVAWAGYGLKTLKRAKELGAKTIVERGSSHILYQANILAEEYKRFGIVVPETHPRIIEKELKEYEEADFISIPSNFVKQSFIERGISEKKLLQVPYGVNLTAFKQVPKEDKVFRVVFAGGMSLRKGVHYLLQAFSELNLPNSELLLIGGMNDEIKPFFKKYRGHYKYVGQKPQGDMYKYFSSGSVFAINSIEEGLALVIPQAMACGLPIIATTNTGGEDVVRNGKDGFIIPIRNIEALKEKLLYFYSNPEVLIEMGRSAKERVSSGFTWNDYGRNIITAYENIVLGH